MRNAALGFLLAFAPAAAFAGTQPDPSQTQQTSPQIGEQPLGAQQNQLDQQSQKNAISPDQNQQMKQPVSGHEEAFDSAKLLPRNAKLVGEAQATEVRTFPEQMGQKGEKASQLQKEEVMGATATDRMWSTKDSYKETVRHVDQTLKSENGQVIAKTITPGATAYNVRTPDGHIINMVVRNTQPTSIESVQLLGAAGTVTPGNQPQGNMQQGMQPQGNMPQGNMPQGNMPQGNMPEHQMPSQPNR